MAQKIRKISERGLKKIKGIILSIVNAAVEGNLSVIDTADLGHATKWKIAFLYQKKTDIKISYIYFEDRLRAYAECFKKDIQSSKIYRQVLERKTSGTDIFSFFRIYGLRLRKSIQTPSLLRREKTHICWMTLSVPI